MDFKDNNEGELDIQSLLDKYLPEEGGTKSAPAAENNNFYISSDAAEESAAPSASDGYSDASGMRAVSSDRAFSGGDGKAPSENVSEMAELPLFDDSVEVPAPDGINDEGFVIDEAAIAKILSEDDAQFGGIEGFEELDSLSGYSIDESEPVPEEVPDVSEPYTAEESAGEPLFADSAEEEERPLVRDGDILNEDDYAEFVNASLDELNSDEATDTDINLIVAFGLEDELKDHVGAKRASKMTKRFDSELERQAERERKTLHDEYRSPAQTKEISRDYKHRYVTLKVKLAIAAVLALLLMVYENLPIVGYQLAGALDPAVYPVVYVMVDLQILLFCFAAAYNEILSGFAAIFKGRLIPESILSVTALVSVVCTSLEAHFAMTPKEPTVFNFPAALCAVMALVYSYLTVKREIFSFNVISSKKPKYALRRLDTKEASPEAAAFGESSEDIGDVLKIEKTSFIDNYFYRTESRNPANSAVILMSIILSFALSCLFGGYAGISGGGGESVVTMGYIAFAASLPISMLLTFSYPFYKANADSYENDSTVVGEVSLEEYSGATVVSFGDDLIFPAAGVKVQNIKVYNNYRFDRVLYYAASVFTKTGGPLSDVFEVATVEMGYSDDVVLTGIGEGYIQTEVNGKSIVFGRAEELRELGINISAEISAEDETYGEDVSVMYMIFKGKVVAKMNISYTLDSDFEYLIKQLAECGMSACIRTFDPNIDEEMIKNKVSLDKYPMRVIKCSSFSDGFAECESCDSGVAARGSAKALLHTVTYCDKVLDTRRTNSFIGLLATILTVVVLAVVLLTDNMSAVKSLFAVLCHLFWMVPMLISTKVNVR